MGSLITFAPLQEFKFGFRYPFVFPHDLFFYITYSLTLKFRCVDRLLDVLIEHFVSLSDLFSCLILLSFSFVVQYFSIPSLCVWVVWHMCASAHEWRQRSEADRGSFSVPSQPYHCCHHCHHRCHHHYFEAVSLAKLESLAQVEQLGISHLNPMLLQC